MDEAVRELQEIVLSIESIYDKKIKNLENEVSDLKKRFEAVEKEIQELKGN